MRFTNSFNQNRVIRLSNSFHIKPIMYQKSLINEQLKSKNYHVFRSSHSKKIGIIKN